MATSTATNPPKTAVKPLRFAFPFRKKAPGNGASSDITDEHEFHELLKKEPSGSFACSREGMWHGGIHVSEGGAGSALDLKHGVRCMADGEVVAWRLNRTYLVSELPAQPGTPAVKATYSTGFALVRHTMEFPKDNKLTFFSLYMHLQDLAGYESEKTLPKPAYWSPDFKVTQFAQDKPTHGPAKPPESNQVGLLVSATPKQGTPLCILPHGTQLTMSKREGDWGKIANTHGAQLIPPKVGGFADASAAVNGWVFLGKRNGHPVVEEVVPDACLDRVVVPSTPFPIKAGDLIGHLGRYDSLNRQAENRMVHIEMFCGDGIKAFIEKGRAWVNDNGSKPKAWEQLGLPSAPTILRVDKNTKLYKEAFKEGKDAPLTDVIQVAALPELAKKADNKRTETAAGSDGEKFPWWRINSANEFGQDISGWVREQNFAGGRVTREFAQSWIDFDATFKDAHDPTHTMFATTKAYVDYKSGADVPERAALGKLSPLMAQVYGAIYPKGDASRAADALCVAAANPWRALRLSRLIIKHESEWANAAKWKQLIQEMAKATGPKPQHEEEQRRIEKLVWWDEVKGGVSDLPGSDVFHIHPVGVVGNFKEDFQFTLAMLQHIFPRADAGALQEMMLELNSHIKLYKLDTELRRNHFFAQTKQEAGPGLAIHTESLNYAAIALPGLFSYFRTNPKEAQLYGRTNQHHADQEAIANRAYADRNGNGDISSGDGWAYRGRGVIQLTGRGNYGRFTRWHRENGVNWLQDANMNFESDPDSVGQIRIAVRSACYFWVEHALFLAADDGANESIVDRITRVINSGLFSSPSSAQKTESINGRRLNFKQINEWGGLQ